MSPAPGPPSATLSAVELRRLIPVGAAVTALLVLAGVASHGRPLQNGHGTGPSAAFFDYVATTLLLVGAAVVVVFVLFIRANPGGGPPRPRGRRHILSTILTLAASVLIAELILHSHFQDRLRGLKPPGTGQTGTQRGQPAEPAHVRNARVRWDEVAIVVAIVTGVGIYLYATRTRRKQLLPLPDPRRRAVSRALDESLDDLRRDPDVRRAIIAAYARMEDALAAAGLARAPAEAPFEYLERSLQELETSAGAARRLTDLFERAKFSQHEPAEAMRDEAIDALIAVRDELR
jgi:hypothetical protein